MRRYQRMQCMGIVFVYVSVGFDTSETLGPKVAADE